MEGNRPRPLCACRRKPRLVTDKETPTRERESEWLRVEDNVERCVARAGAGGWVGGVVGGDEGDKMPIIREALVQNGKEFGGGKYKRDGIRMSK